MKFESKAIAATFFEQVSSVENGNVTVTKFRCHCGVERTQNLKKGYQNLVSHIKEHHNNWQDIMTSKTLEDNTKITRFVNKKSSTVFSWLEWIVMANLPFVFVENELTRKNTKLDLFNKNFSNLIFMVGDNAPVNKSLADLLGVPFIGCASHRFNLACKRYLDPFETTLTKINDLMKTLSNIKQAGKLRKKTDLEPVKRNVTRWSSTYEMVKRFFEIKPFIDDEDPDLACNLPSGMI
jgi:hypothetical protein